MSDWVRILVSALAGVLTGILLEPIRQWIGNAITAHHAKQAIYAELGKIHRILESKSAPADPLRIVKQLDCQAFDYYYASKREVVYLIAEYPGIVSLFDKVHRLKKRGDDGERISAQELEVLANAIIRCEETGEIDGAALHRGAQQFQQRRRRGMAYVRAAREGR